MVITKNNPSLLSKWKVRLKRPIINTIYSNRSVDPINSNRWSHGVNEQKTKNRSISVSRTKNGPGISFTKSYDESNTIDSE
jgi:hypothetical protein